MTAHSVHTAPSRAARSLRWLLDRLVEEVPGLLSVAVVSSDGLMLLSSDPGTPGVLATPGIPEAPATPGARVLPGAGQQADGGTAAGLQRGPRGSSAELATIVSGLGSLTSGAAELMEGGKVRQTVITMGEGSLCVMAIGDGSLLGVHAATGTDMGLVAYHMAYFVSRAGRVLSPELRSELRHSTAPAAEPLPGGAR